MFLPLTVDEVSDSKHYSMASLLKVEADGQVNLGEFFE